MCGHTIFTVTLIPVVYRFNKIEGRTDFSDQLRKIIMCYKHIGYNLNVMQQSVCLVLTQEWLLCMYM